MKSLKEKLKTTGRWALLTCALSGGGYGLHKGCDYLDRLDTSVAPEKIDFNRKVVSIRDFSRDGVGREAYIWDINEDGVADGIGFGGVAYWIAPEYFGEYRYGRPRIITPEIRNALTEAMQSNRNALRLMAEESWRLTKEKTQGDKK